MRRPLISVLIPVRDGEATLDACLRSLGRQHLSDWECVLVDDGSRDGTGALVARAARVDARIRPVSSPPQGIVSALTIGLRECRGRYVARMDADDLMLRDRLAMQSAALEADAGLAAVGCHVRLFPRRDLTPGHRAYEAWLNSIVTEDQVRREAFVECPVAHPSLMIRREVLQALSYRETPWAEDYDLMLRLVEAGHRVGVVPRRLVAWRDTETRLTRTDERYAIERFPQCKAYFLARGFLAAADTYVLWGYGDTGRTLARALGALGKRLTSIIEVHPRRIGQRIGGVPVLGIEALSGLRGQPIVASVAGARARGEIRAHLDGLGFVELRDYVCAA